MGHWSIWWEFVDVLLQNEESAFYCPTTLSDRQRLIPMLASNGAPQTNKMAKINVVQPEVFDLKHSYHHYGNCAAHAISIGRKHGCTPVLVHFFHAV